MKVLFITKEFVQNNLDGGAVVTKRNHKMLVSLFGPDNVDIIQFQQPTLIQKLINVLHKQSYGHSKAAYKLLLKKIKSTKYAFVFFNSSLYGPIVKLCHRKKIKTIVFYHNVETNYYYDMWKNKKTLLTFIFYKYVKNIEFKSSRYSDFRITLNSRDKNELKKQYGIASNCILPLSLDYPSRIDERTNQNVVYENYCLFLGSDFFANQHGVSWFIENVLPHINIKLVLVGSICNSIKAKYGLIKNLEYKGYVEDIGIWYHQAAFIVSPIFLGSGMKTKTVEALSYGKAIIGTDEAFVGIDADFNKIGAKCNTADEFIKAINNFSGSIFNEYAFSWFSENLSNNKVFMQFKEFVNINIGVV